MPLEDFLIMQEKCYKTRLQQSQIIRNLSIETKEKFDSDNLGLWNVPNWILEINNLSFAIYHELISTISYNEVLKSMDFSENQYGNALLKRDICLKNVLYNLFSFRDKISYLFYEVLLRNLKIKKKGKLMGLSYGEVSYKRIRWALNSIDEVNLFVDNISHINENELNSIKISCYYSGIPFREFLSSNMIFK